MSDALGEPASVGGEFWMSESPDVRVRGEFNAEEEKKPEVSLEAALVDDPRLQPFQGGIAFSGAAADSVKAFLPITLQGQLDTGEAVTLLTARNHGSRGLFGAAPRYVADVVVRGDSYVAGEDQLYSAVRFRLDHPYWLGHLAAGEPTVVADDRSTLSVETSDDGNWLVYSSQRQRPCGSWRFGWCQVVSCWRS
jgi:hypothetical protein